MVPLYAQEEQELEEQFIESLLEDLDDNVDISEWTERLRYFLKHPIDLNKTDGTDLAELMFLLPTQISSLLAYRQSSGNFVSVLELQGIEGFDIEVIRKLTPFVKIGGSTLSGNLSNASKIVDHDLLIRYGKLIQKQVGFEITDTTRSRYLGSPDRLALRYRLDYKGLLKFSLNAEKDAGEPFFGKLQPTGFDYYSMSLEVKNRGVFKQIIIGDYALQYGQGLVMWNGLSFGKGSWVGSVVKQATGLRPYRSMNEFNFQRGLATVIQIRKIEITPFIAYNSLTANLQNTGQELIATSISSSGYHRTPNELKNKDALKQLVVGTAIGYQYKHLKIGLTGVSTSYNHQVTNGNELRNKFSFAGNQLSNVGVHYQYNYKNTFAYGEIAYSSNNAWAMLNGIITSVHPKLSVLLQHRYYQKDYQSIHGQAIGENSRVSNEKGFYFGTIYKIVRKIEWMNYLDYYRFPWLSFRLNSPSDGLDFFSQMTYTWYKKGRLIARYRHRFNQQNESLIDRNEAVSADVSRQQVRFDFQYNWGKAWRTSTRAEAVRFSKEFNPKEYGIMGYQDVHWASAQNGWTSNIRIAYFNTDSYNARIYAYESDVLYASSFPVYYMRGWRGYINTKIRIKKGLDFWARYAITSIYGVDQIGSGLDQINGNKRSDFRIQLRYQW